MEIITKKYPIVVIVAGLLSITLIASAVGGEGSVISGAMIQAGWCTEGNYICLFWYYFWISIGILLLAVVVQIIINKIHHNNKDDTSKSKASVALQVTGDRNKFINTTIIANPANSITVYNIDSKKEEQHQIPSIGDKAKLPDRKELAYQMGLDVQEYEKRFNSIRDNRSFDETKQQFKPTRELLNKLLDEWLPKSNLILKNANEVRDTLIEMNVKLNQYAMTIDWLFSYRASSELYAKDTISHQPISQSIINQVIQSIDLLWGSDKKSYKVQMNDLIKQLTHLLNQEINNQQMLKENVQNDNKQSHFTTFPQQRFHCELIVKGTTPNQIMNYIRNSISSNEWYTDDYHQKIGYTIDAGKTRFFDPSKDNSATYGIVFCGIIYDIEIRNGKGHPKNGESMPKLFTVSMVSSGLGDKEKVRIFFNTEIKEVVEFFGLMKNELAQEFDVEGKDENGIDGPNIYNALRSVNLDIEKYVFPNPINSTIVGVKIHNLENYELTDICLKLIELKKTQFSSTSSGNFNSILIRIDDNQCDFDLKGDFRIRAKNKRTIHLGEMRNNEFILLMKEPLDPEHLYKEQHPSIHMPNAVWELKLELNGKIQGNEFRKEVFYTRIGVTGKTVSFLGEIKRVE